MSKTYIRDCTIFSALGRYGQLLFVLSLISLLIMSYNIKDNRYRLMFPDGSIVVFEKVNLDAHLKNGEWSVCDNFIGDRYDKVFKNNAGEYIAKYIDSVSLMFHSENDIKKTLSTDVVFFRGIDEGVIHPFVLLSRKDVDELKSRFVLVKFEFSTKKGVFGEADFYYINNDWILSLHKYGGEGTLHSSVDDLLAYYNFIEGHDLNVIIYGVKK